MPAELEIHHINVSQGDSTLLINRDIALLKTRVTAVTYPKQTVMPANDQEYLPFAVGQNIEARHLYIQAEEDKVAKTRGCTEEMLIAARKKAAAEAPVIVDLRNTIRAAVLIDAGDKVFGASVADYIKDQGLSEGEANEKLCTVATHYHADHVSGFRDVFFKSYHDQTSTPGAIRYAPKIAYECGAMFESGSKFRTYPWDTQVATNYGEYVDGLGANTKRETLHPLYGIFHLGVDSNNEEISLLCLASNGLVATDDETWDNKLTEALQGEQNCRSVVLILQYGNFRYFLGADATGTGSENGGNFGANEYTRLTLKSIIPPYPDIETGIRTVLPVLYQKDPTRTHTVAGHMCGFFVNHHGSGSSNDTYLLAAMKPKFAVYSCGVITQFYYHPTQQVLNRIDPSAGYSPDWPIPGAPATTTPPTTANTVEGYYITEMAREGFRFNTNGPFNRTFSDMGKVLGDIIVRPLAGMFGDSTTNANPITIQIYGTANTAAVTGVTRREIRPFSDMTAGQDIYAVGPFEHTCHLH